MDKTIAAHHRPMIERTAEKLFKGQVHARRLFELYREASALFRGTPTTTAGQIRWAAETVNNDRVARVTEEETGIYVQLAGKPGQTVDQLQLTVGQFHAVEFNNGSGTAIRTWDV